MSLKIILIILPSCNNADKVDQLLVPKYTILPTTFYKVGNVVNLYYIQYQCK